MEFHPDEYVLATGSGERFARCLDLTPAGDNGSGHQLHICARCRCRRPEGDLLGHGRAQAAVVDARRGAPAAVAQVRPRRRHRAHRLAGLTQGSSFAHEFYSQVCVTPPIIFLRVGVGLGAGSQLRQR